MINKIGMIRSKLAFALPYGLAWDKEARMVFAPPGWLFRHGTTDDDLWPFETTSDMRECYMMHEGVEE